MQGFQGLLGSRGLDHLNVGGGFNPITALWPTGTEAGMYLAPWESGDVFQESTGTTAGVLNSPAGLRIDRRFGPSPGAELNDGSWTLSAGATESPVGTFTLTTSGVTDVSASNSFVSVADAWYRFTFTKASAAGVSTDLYITVGQTAGATQSYGAFWGDIAAGTYTVYFKATSATTVIRFANVTDGATTSVVSGISYVSFLGNHILQATSAARPTWKLDGAIYSDLLDGADDVYGTSSFSAGTFTADMDAFIAIKKTLNTAMVLTADALVGAKYFGYASNGSATAATDTSGTPTYYVDGVQLAGGTAVTAGTLYTALNDGAWHILEVRNLDLSAWVGLHFGQTALLINGNLGGRILCPAQTDVMRAKIRTFLGAKAGLSL